MNRPALAPIAGVDVDRAAFRQTSSEDRVSAQGVAYRFATDQRQKGN